MHTFNLMSAYSDYFVRFQMAIGLLSALLHIFAAGVARDIRKLHRLHIETRFIPATAWILATNWWNLGIGHVLVDAPLNACKKVITMFFVKCCRWIFSILLVVYFFKLAGLCDFRIELCPAVPHWPVDTIMKITFLVIDFVFISLIGSHRA